MPLLHNTLHSSLVLVWFGLELRYQKSWIHYFSEHLNFWYFKKCPYYSWVIHCDLTNLATTHCTWAIAYKNTISISEIASVKKGNAWTSSQYYESVPIFYQINSRGKIFNFLKLWTLTTYFIVKKDKFILSWHYPNSLKTVVGADYWDLHWQQFHYLCRKHFQFKPLVFLYSTGFQTFLALTWTLGVTLD